MYTVYMLGTNNQILPSLTLQTHPPPSGGISFPFFVSTKKSSDNDFATFEGHFQTIFQDLERDKAKWPCGPSVAYRNGNANGWLVGCLAG